MLVLIVLQIDNGFYVSVNEGPRNNNFTESSYPIPSLIRSSRIDRSGIPVAEFTE